MTNAEKLTLAKHACHIRMGVIEGTHSAKCGHPGGSLDIAEVLSYLYFVDMNIDPKEPKKPDRDRFVLSKGHAAPALYATLAERGFFPVEDLKTLRKIGSYLQGHPNMNETPGVDMSTGSLGQGVSAACGMALGAKHSGKPINVYTILGDGEVEEGECWEAFMFAAHYKLSNLCVMLDRNHLQIDGTTETVMNSAPLEEKLKAFNFNVLTINGHDYDQIESAIKAFHAENDKPTCIILDTVKGTGVSFMTNSVDWHGKGPNDEEYAVAMQELNAAYAALEQELRVPAHRPAESLEKRCERIYRSWGLSTYDANKRYLTGALRMMMGSDHRLAIRKEILGPVAEEYGLTVAAVDSALRRLLETLDETGTQTWRDFRKEYGLERRKVTIGRLLYALESKLSQQ